MDSHSDVRLLRGTTIGLADAVMALLPETGSVEVQRDTPRREHRQHTHSTDETLLIIDGEITFHVGERDITCTSGDRILLPAEVPHGSTAGASGCLYIIATRFVES